MQKGIGVICLVAGVLLAVWARNISSSIGSQLHEAVTGAPVDKAMHLYIAAAVVGLFGLFLIFWRK